MFEIDDIVANSLGALLGYLFFESFDGIIKGNTRKNQLLMEQA